LIGQIPGLCALHLCRSGSCAKARIVQEGTNRTRLRVPTSMDLGPRAVRLLGYETAITSNPSQDGTHGQLTQIL
jgi:hypothetical protein